MEFNKSLLHDIGFDSIQDILSNISSFEENKNSFKTLTPFKKINDIKESQNYSQELIDSFIRKDQVVIDGCINIDDILHSLNIKGHLLEKEEFKELRSIFTSSQLLKEGKKKKIENIKKEKKVKQRIKLLNGELVIWRGLNILLPKYNNMLAFYAIMHIVVKY